MFGHYIHLSIAMQGHLLVKDGQLDTIRIGSLVFPVLDQNSKEQNRVLAVN